jgi:hypothetical protein
VAHVSQREAARVSQRVWMNPGETRPLGRGSNQVSDRLPSERLAAIGHKKPGHCVGAQSELTLDGTQLVTGNGLIDR